MVLDIFEYLPGGPAVGYDGHHHIMMFLLTITSINKDM